MTSFLHAISAPACAGAAGGLSLPRMPVSDAAREATEYQIVFSVTTALLTGGIAVVLAGLANAF